MEKDMGKAALNQRREPESGENKVVGISKEPAAANAGLEAIQDILFGEQLRSSNEQISDLQKNSEKTLLNLSSSIDERFDELTTTMNEKFEILVKQLADQKNTQHTADERVTNGLAACKTALTQSIDSTREDLNERLNRMVNEMEDKKLDRGKLSEMFTQVAKELASSSIAPATSKS